MFTVILSGICLGIVGVGLSLYFYRPDLMLMCAVVGFIFGAAVAAEFQNDQRHLWK